MQEHVAELKPLAVKPLTAFRMVDFGHSKGYELIRRGILKTIRIGSDQRVTLDSLERLVQNGGAK